jgi:hypothetical protein
MARLSYPSSSCFSGDFMRFPKWIMAVLVMSLVMFPASAALAQSTTGAGQIGVWTILPTASNMPVNPVHAAVMHTGKVLIIEGKQTKQGAIWDPATRTASTIPVPYTMFCDAMVVLPDGDPFVVGGTNLFPPPKFTGTNQCAAYNPLAGPLGSFSVKTPMKEGRWYPTAIVLSDGRVMAFAGNDEAPDINNSVEFFTADPTGGPGSWSGQFFDTLFNPPLYPRLHLLPDGRVFYSMSDVTLTSRFFDVSTQTWLTCCHTVSNSIRVYGTSVLLPLSPANNYKARVIIMGGGQFDTVTHSTKTTETIDFPDPSGTPHWTMGKDMSQPRIQLNATILPSGRVLVTGGSDLNEDLNSVSFNADLYNPVTNTFGSAGMNAVPRLYHSNALLLPDATVLVFGNNHPPAPFSPYDPRVELYQPAYLFKADGTPAPRPVINTVPAGSIGYGSTFQITTPDPASVSSVLLVRPAGVTHAFNMEQRLIKLNFSVNTSLTGTLDVTAPPNGNVAPPGFYMLFILNSTSSATSTGTPSVAKFVQICPASGCL